MHDAHMSHVRRGRLPAVCPVAQLCSLDNLEPTGCVDGRCLPCWVRRGFSTRTKSGFRNRNTFFPLPALAPICKMCERIFLPTFADPNPRPDPSPNPYGGPTTHRLPYVCMMSSESSIQQRPRGWFVRFREQSQIATAQQLRDGWLGGTTDVCPISAPMTRADPTPDTRTIPGSTRGHRLTCPTQSTTKFARKSKS